MGILKISANDIFRDFNKFLIGLGSFFGTVGGSYIPGLWGDDSFSLMGILFSIIGGVVVILLGYQLAKRLGYTQ